VNTLRLARDLLVILVRAVWFIPLELVKQELRGDRETLLRERHSPD